MSALRPQASTRGAGGATEPGNKRDRERFYVLTDEQRDLVAGRSVLHYMSNSNNWTVARCWKEALDDIEAHYG